MNAEELKQMTEEALSNYDDKVIALAQHLGLNVEPNFSNIDEDSDEEEQKEQAQESIKEVTDELDNITEESDYLYTYYNEEYHVCTDEEADDLWEQELDYYLDECVLPEIPEHLRNYFDEEAWKRDAKYDGRGHAISRYDGDESEETVNDVTYYIYRQN